MEKKIKTIKDQAMRNEEAIRKITKGSVLKDRPIATKAGKRQFIKQLSKNMEQKFLDKIDHIPDHWDGIEIRAWMATTWAAENLFTNQYHMDSHNMRRRAREFRNDLITRPL